MEPLGLLQRASGPFPGPALAGIAGTGKPVTVAPTVTTACPTEPEKVFSRIAGAGP
jgi:hypothetical protein